MKATRFIVWSTVVLSIGVIVSWPYRPDYLAELDLETATSIIESVAIVVLTGALVLLYDQQKDIQDKQSELMEYELKSEIVVDGYTEPEPGVVGVILSNLGTNTATKFRLTIEVVNVSTDEYVRGIWPLESYSDNYVENGRMKSHIRSRTSEVEFHSDISSRPYQIQTYRDKPYFEVNELDEALVFFNVQYKNKMDETETASWEQVVRLPKEENDDFFDLIEEDLTDNEQIGVSHLVQ